MQNNSVLYSHRLWSKLCHFVAFYFKMNFILLDLKYHSMGGPNIDLYTLWIIGRTNLVWLLHLFSGVINTLICKIIFLIVRNWRFSENTQQLDMDSCEKWGEKRWKPLNNKPKVKSKKGKKQIHSFDDYMFWDLHFFTPSHWYGMIFAYLLA